MLLFYILNSFLSFLILLSHVYLFWALNLNTFAQGNLSLFEKTKSEFMMVDVPTCKFFWIKTGCRIKKKKKKCSN